MRDAERLVLEFFHGPWTRPWESLVMPVLESLNIQPGTKDREEIAAQAGRRLRFEFEAASKTHGRWKKQQWSSRDVERVIDIIVQHSFLTSPLEDHVEDEPIFLGEGSKLYSRWQLVRSRSNIPWAPGVYLIGLDPKTEPDPLDRSVVYIGESNNLAYRLNQFAESARTGGGQHSGGWTYFLDIHQDSAAKRSRLHKTYCSWTLADDPLSLETTLIAKYREKYGTWPRLNRRG